MSYRLTKIYTRQGDHGETRLADGTRLSKDNLRIAALGAVDELNCALGALLCHDLSAGFSKNLGEVQHALFELGAELSLPGEARIHAADVEKLEQCLDEINAALPPLREFILPGGTPTAAACHNARAVCRRAERDLTALHREHSLNPHSLAYLNRLSDLLFVMARALAGDEAVLWQPRR